MGIGLNLEHNCTPEELKWVCELMIEYGYGDTPLTEISLNELRPCAYFPRGLTSFGPIGGGEEVS